MHHKAVYNALSTADISVTNNVPAPKIELKVLTEYDDSDR